MKKKKEYKYSPSEYKGERKIDTSKYSEEEIKYATEQVESENIKKASKISKISTLWTIISTIYAIVSTASFIATDWVDSTFSLVLLVILIVYIIVFLVLIVLIIKKPNGKKIKLGPYKKMLKIFKAFANVVFLVLSAVSMAGLADNGMTVTKWIVFMATLFVAVFQLIFKIAKFAFNIIRKKKYGQYKVQVKRYVNGKEQKAKITDKVEETTYK